jgi:AAA domain
MALYQVAISPVSNESLKVSTVTRKRQCTRYVRVSTKLPAVSRNPFAQCHLACLQVITAKDFALIQGLPGTGKTSTLAFIARVLVARGKRVLVTSYTHAAVDNVLLKLLDVGMADVGPRNPFPAVLRLGQVSSCHAGTQHILASPAALAYERKENQLHYDLPSAETLQECVSAARVVGVTALSVPRSALLVSQHFDVVIVDEAGQISQPAILGALMAAEMFVLVGDHKQLPPLVSSEAAEQGGTCLVTNTNQQDCGTVSQLRFSQDTVLQCFADSQRSTRQP